VIAACVNAGLGFARTLNRTGRLKMDGDRISFDDTVSRRTALFGVALGSTFALAAEPGWG
jgi:hypothetical protein